MKTDILATESIHSDHLKVLFVMMEPVTSGDASPYGGSSLDAENEIYGNGEIYSLDLNDGTLTMASPMRSTSGVSLQQQVCPFCLL